MYDHFSHVHVTFWLEIEQYRRGNLVPEESGPRFARHTYQKPQTDRRQKWSRFLFTYGSTLVLCQEDDDTTFHCAMQCIIAYQKEYSWRLYSFVGLFEKHPLVSLLEVFQSL